MVAEVRDVRIPDIPASNQQTGQRVQEERKSAEIVSGGSIGEAIAGIAGLVLGIIGLCGVMPSWMASIAIIALGAGLILQGASVAARYYSLLDETGRDDASQAELGGGLGAEIVGGGAGIVLGILALAGVYPHVLVPVAAIVFGATLVLGCATNMRLNDLVVGRRFGGREIKFQRAASDVMSAANGTQALVGLAAIVLGIIGLIGTYPWMTLSLIAFIAVGASILLSGGVLAAKLMPMVRRR